MKTCIIKINFKCRYNNLEIKWFYKKYNFVNACQFVKLPRSITTHTK